LEIGAVGSWDSVIADGVKPMRLVQISAHVCLLIAPCGETKLWALSNLRALPGVGFECLLERLPGVGCDRRSMRHQDELDR
jgi:hypothetical protein